MDILFSNNKKGFTLLEIMVALVIIAIILIIFLQGSEFASRQLVQSRDYNIANDLAVEKLENIRAAYGKFIPFEWLDLNNKNARGDLENRVGGHENYIGAGWDNLGGNNTTSRNFHGKEFTRYWLTYPSFQFKQNGDEESNPITASDNNPRGYMVVVVYVEWEEDGKSDKKSLQRLMILR
ncbi:MAG: prepilin-type N-terminal cleavage/methylation domain-containing protein [bacterium]